MNSKNQFLLIIVLLISLSSFGQKAKAKKESKKETKTETTEVLSKEIKWMSLKDAMAKNEKTKKKFILDFFTDWCGWCKKMDASTYEDPSVIAMINKYYYPVKFNAEREEPITFKGKEHKIPATGGRGTHSLVPELLGNRIGYPTSAFLNSDLSTIQVIPGYIQADEMKIILQYFGEDKNKTTNYDDYKKSFTK